MFFPPQYCSCFPQRENELFPQEELPLGCSGNLLKKKPLQLAEAGMALEGREHEQEDSQVHSMLSAEPKAGLDPMTLRS